MDDVDRQLTERNFILEILKANLAKAQDSMKLYANGKRLEVHYTVGDFVYLKIQLYCLKSLAQRVNEKLSPGFMVLI